MANKDCIHHILSSIMCIQVQCAPEFHNDFWLKNYFCFSTIISQELIIPSLFIVKAILNPFSATFHVQCSGNISASFSMYKSAHYTRLNTVIQISNYFTSKVFHRFCSNYFSHNGFALNHFYQTLKSFKALFKLTKVHG